MNTLVSLLSRSRSKWIAGSIVVLTIVTAPWWWAWMNSIAESLTDGSVDNAAMADDEPADDHTGHDHAEHDHDASEAVELSPQARRNLRLEVGEIRPSTYTRAITIPALVTEQPGKTHHVVSAPMTGIVTGVSIVENQMVDSGDLLFTVRLTHEDLVKAQTEFLATLGRLDVERREVQRLQQVSTGVLPQKVILERQYEVEKLEAILKAEQSSLNLHGLSDKQIENIAKERKLVREVSVRVPFLHADSSVHTDGEHDGGLQVDQDHEVFSQKSVVSRLDVRSGQAVQTGQPMCQLTDYAALYIEGRAFEQDADILAKAAQQTENVSAIPLSGESRSVTAIESLSIQYVANEIEEQSRALHFYVGLPNEIVRDSRHNGHRFVTWKYKPGQRMQLQIPVETWDDVLVLPVDAVGQEGPETFVFVENGDHFDRRPVHVMHRDQRNTVIANDGSLFPGESIALNAAHQLQMAIKNKSGGAVDPHHGHNH